MSAIEQSSEIIVITDTEGTILYVNPAFEQVTGYTRQEALGENHRFLKSGKQDSEFYQNMWQALLHGETWRGRIVNKKKDGYLYTEDAVISPVRDTSGETVNYVAVKRDVIGEMKLEAQLRQAQKMESVGRLAGGVAHDFNNMLGVILGYAELIRVKMDADHEFHAYVQEIKKDAQHSADLTRQLLAFARNQSVSPRILNLNEKMSGMINMLRRLIGEDIDLAWEPGAQLWTIKIDPSQIDQLQANLCVNARGAIDGVGKVIIETANVSLDEACCAGSAYLIPGEYVQLAVSDTGCGMNEETMAQIFEPFFTTKGPTDGTGLGLATVYGIVKQNNGCINVYSEPGNGTTIKIYLPRYTGDAEKIQANALVRVDVHGHETVLLVEDEPSLITLSKEMLETMDYEVLAANTPGEAMALAESRVGTIDLVLTDVIMPEMNGRDLAERLSMLYPGIKRLFISGYTANIIAHHGVLDDAVHFLQKPFSQHELAAKMREALDEECVKV